MVTSRRKKPADPRAAHAAITIPDICSQRCDIKSISLLPNVLGKQPARERGAFEAWQVDRGRMVCEGTSTKCLDINIGCHRSDLADSAILNGLTRPAVLDIIGHEGYSCVERPLSVAEARSARGASLTSTIADLLPVVRIDGVPLGKGQRGPLSRKLRKCYLAHAASMGSV
jgi:D-alanine transaminase